MVLRGLDGWGTEPDLLDVVAGGCYEVFSDRRSANMGYDFLVNRRAMSMLVYGLAFLCIAYGAGLLYGWILTPVVAVLGAGVVWERFYKK